MGPRGLLKRFERNRAAVLEAQSGDFGSSQTSKEPQASAKAENLRFSLYGAHKALLASIELPHNGNIWCRVKHSRPHCPGSPLPVVVAILPMMERSTLILAPAAAGGGDPDGQEPRRGPRA